jgi:hypothetical protein
LLNNQPLSYTITPSDPYYGYYFTGSSIGSFVESSNFVFKFIGRNFDTNDGSGLQYEIIGLSQAVSGLTSNITTGWQTGDVITIGQNVDTYNITARVFKASNPSLTSETFLFSITVVGDISLAITWLTDSDLGTINNGTVSDLSVVAESSEGIQLNYRIIGNQFDSNLKTIVSTGSSAPFISFGDLGASVTGSNNGITWAVNPTISPTFNNYYFKSAYYDSVNNASIVVGADEFNNGIILRVETAPLIWTNLLQLATQSLNDIIFDGTQYITVGNNGTLIKTNNISNWSPLVVTGTTKNINSICFTGTKYVMVGDQGLIMTSTNLVAFTQITPLSSADLKSIIWTGTRYIAVGDIGTILTSVDGTVWTSIEGFNANFNKVFYKSSKNTVIIVGQGGVIIRAQETTDPLSDLNYIPVTNLVTANDLYGTIYQTTVGNVDSYLIVGDYGAVLKLDINLTANTVNITSPTLGNLPPNLYLNSSGEIVGRLAFESTSAPFDPLGTTNTYTTRIQAYSPDIAEISSVKTFTLNTYQEFQYPWDTVYMKLLSDQATRNKLVELLDNNSIIDPQVLYRPTDPYFGKSTDVIYNLFYGVPSTGTGNPADLSTNWFPQYLTALQQNFYWRNITLGPIKTAVARNTAGDIIYEVVYSEIVDDLINPQGKSISKEIIWPRNILRDNSDYWTSTTGILSDATYYDKTPAVKKIVTVTSSTVFILNNVDGLVQYMNVTVPGHNLDSVPPRITAISNNTITLSAALPVTVVVGAQLVFSEPVFTSLDTTPSRDLYPNSTVNMRQQLEDQLGQVNNPVVLPRWMTSQQVNGNTTGYVSAWVICYTLPGYAQQVKTNIETQWPYKLNQINFQLDRIEVDRSLTYNYVGRTGNIPIWDTLPSAQPFPQPENAQDQYVYFPQKTILPNGQ